MNPEALFRDPLTGAYSRAALQERFREELQRAWRYKLNVSLMLLDLDYFKSINDAFGHTRGDQVLSEFVQRLGSLVRETDLLFRYGGDEFVLLLPHTTKAQAEALAERLLEGVRSEPFGEKPQIVLSMSIGVAAFPDDAQTPEALFEKADIRHYAAKRSGRGRVVAEDPARTEALDFSEQSRLVEREHDFTALQRFLDGLPEQRRGLLVISGARGSGRSTFLADSAKAARLRGFAVLTLRGTGALRARAYGALTEAQKNWAGLPAPAEGRGKFIKALRELLEAKEHAGLLITVDDLAELDQATLDLLRTLFAAPDFPVLGLAYASDRQHFRHSFQLDAPLQETVLLEPLSREGVHIWLRSVLQWEPPDAFVAWFFGETAGYPGFMRRGITHLVEKSFLSKDDQGWNLEGAFAEIRLAERLQVHTEAAPNNLPALPTSFVGREGEIQEVKQLIEERRMVTLIGPGGVGKTRLAIQAASELLEQFPDGVWFVPLAGVTSADFIVSTVAGVLRLAFQRQEDPTQQLLNFLRGKIILLVMDNFEHLIEGAPLVSEMLLASTGVKVLATSRERLHLPEEWLLELDGLGLPQGESEAEALDSGAVQLFVERARGVQPRFVLAEAGTATVAHICRLAQGMPLGIELAAAWARVLSCEEIAVGIEENLDFLVTSHPEIPDRHRSLRGAFEYSWGLLSEEERRVFARLSVFRGGFRRDAAERVAGASLLLLSALMDKSLLRRSTNMRYELHDQLRQYAGEKLTAHPEELREVQNRHCEFYAGFLAQKEPLLNGDRQKLGLEQISEEIENVRAGWTWAADHAKEAFIRMCMESLFRFHEIRALVQEGAATFAWAAGRLREQGIFSDTLAHLLSRQGRLARRFGQFETYKDLARESLEIARRCGTPAEMPVFLNCMADAHYALGEYAESQHLYAESLASCRENPSETTIMEVARATNNLGLVADAMGNKDEAKRFFEEGLARFRDLGNPWGTVVALTNLGEFACARGESFEAQQYFKEALKGAMELKAVFVVLDLLTGVATLLAHEEKKGQAVLLLGYVLEHPSLEREYKAKAELLFAELAAELPSEAIAAARSRARTARLEDVVAEVLSQEM
jgi:diguanylate cyclase (GGDEF)-like protein